MVEMARDIIGTQPILALFLAIGVGYLVGQINIGGFSLGVGAVLFVGLAIGAFAPKAQITGPIGLTGLIMFLYGIGILYGRQFFEGMSGAEGRKYNLLALVAVVAGLLVALGLGQAFGIKVGHTLGIFAGSMTSTATLQAALDVMRNSEPSIGYSVAYPFGVMPADRKEEVRRHFGDTVKATAEFSYVSLGLGMVLGVLLGLIPIPIPGVGTVTLGIGGGPLIVALIVGKLRRTGPLLWVMPLPANIVLRNFGLAMFLATVGINAGQPFVRTVSETGLTMLFVGAAVLLTTVIIVLLVGYYLLKIPYDDLVGVASGATGNPAILVYSTRMAPTERPDIGYAMIFPSMTIVKVIAVQIVGLLVATGAG
jgi:AspT/YidE/YbjL antiporter-like protein